MKVLHSELECRFGGIESFLLNLMQARAMKDIQFYFLMKGTNSEIQRLFEEQGGTVLHVPNSSQEYIRFVRQLLRREQFDVVHIHKNSAANPLLPILVKQYGDSKIILHSHNTQPSTRTSLKVALHKINRPLLNWTADVRLACSELAGKWMFGKRNFEIIRNGIYPERFACQEAIRREKRAELRITDNEYVIGHVGTMREQKNHRFMVKLMEEVGREDVKMVFVGDGPVRPEIEEMISERGLQEKILLLGARQDVAELMMAFDLFILPSFHEGLPVSAIEAQASGLPVLLSDRVSKMTKITTDVHFLNIDDTQSWVNAIERAKQHKIRYDNAAAVSENGYDMNRSADIIKKLYIKICEN